jgi:hypothetical protein
MCIEKHLPDNFLTIIDWSCFYIFNLIKLTVLFSFEVELFLTSNYDL